MTDQQQSPAPSGDGRAPGLGPVPVDLDDYVPDENDRPGEPLTVRELYDARVADRPHPYPTTATAESED